jgi:hypothetical protein
MEPSPFWKGVRQEATAGLIIAGAVAAVTGIFYLSYTVPTKLDDVLSNQQEIKSRFSKAEETIQDHEQRLIKLELFPQR